MQIGKLDRRIRIEEPVYTSDGYSEVVEWIDVGEVWAQVLQPTGREFLARGQELAEQSVVFKIRYKSGINERMRVFYNSRYHNIQEIKELGRREGLELHTTATDQGTN